MASYFKLKNSNKSNGDIQVVNTLLVGTSENRHHAPIEGCDDMPPLLNYDGTIYDINNELSNLESSKESIFKNINYIYKNAIIKYTTVDPTYLSDKKKISKDDSNYAGHIQKLLIDIPDNIMYDSISVIGCYQDFFDIKNIDKIIKILNPDGYIIIHDTVPYYYSEYFNSIFYEIM